MYCKDAIDKLQQEPGIQLKQVSHAHHNFWVYVPERDRKEPFEPNFVFNNMSDVIRLQSITNRSFVAPIFYANQSQRPILIVQMEIRPGANNTFEEHRDRRAFEIVSKIVSGIFERIFVNSRTSDNANRAYIILKACK